MYRYIEPGICIYIYIDICIYIYIYIYIYTYIEPGFRLWLRLWRDSGKEISGTEFQGAWCRGQGWSLRGRPCSSPPGPAARRGGASTRICSPVTPKRSVFYCRRASASTAHRQPTGPNIANLLVRIHSSPPAPAARRGGVSTRKCSPANPRRESFIDNLLVRIRQYATMLTCIFRIQGS